MSPLGIGYRRADELQSPNFARLVTLMIEAAATETVTARDAHSDAISANFWRDARLASAAIPRRARGYWPLFIAMPLIYWPKILDGDTQPWVPLAALWVAVAYWPRRSRYFLGEGLLVLGLALAAILVFALRTTDASQLLRYGVILGTFGLLWLVGLRDQGEQAQRGVRWSIVIWFALALYQVIATRVGLPVSFFGRYLADRSGVPSLTAEPSFYGSISALQVMYLVTLRERRDNVYIAMAVLGVMFSGSVLAMLMLLFPLARLPLRIKILAGFALAFVLFLGFNLSQLSFLQRLQAFNLADIGTVFVLQDASTNLRVGHVAFTFWDSLWRELLFQSSPNFQLEYFGFSQRTGLFIPNESDFILPSGGELLFRSGFVGFLLIAALLRHAWYTAKQRYDRVEKLAFTIVCLMSPIALLNPFFVFYIQSRYVDK